MAVEVTNDGVGWLRRFRARATTGVVTHQLGNFAADVVGYGPTEDAARAAMMIVGANARFALAMLQQDDSSARGSIGMSRHCDHLERRAVDLEAERRTAIKAAEAIMHTMLGYLPDEPGDARVIRERIQDWLRRDAVKDIT